MKTLSVEPIHSFPFSTSATPEPPDILGGKTPDQFLAMKYQRGCFFGLEYLKGGACYKLAGWQFDFSPWLKRFIVSQHGRWQTVYAPNKTAVRRSTYGRIDEIISAPV